MNDEHHLPDDRKERKAQRKIAKRTDRSKFKKTDREKRERLQKQEKAEKLAKKNLLRGRVLSIIPDGLVVDRNGTELICTLSGVLKKEKTRLKNLVTVGDFVLFEAEKLSIAHIEERTSVLARKEHTRRRTQQLIAANIDQVLITVSVVSPPLKPALVDRYIIATLKGNMEPVILINKIDLLKDEKEEKALFDTFVKTYRGLSLTVLPLSVETGEGVEDLRQVMEGKASVFSGQSGVGKSSLINTVAGLNLQIGDVIKKTGKGTHTTSTTNLIPLEFGGWCIDTPGIRSFGLWDLKAEDLLFYFPEINDVGQGCKYPNCSHSHEPQCAVIKAVEEEEISRLRYESFLRLFAEIS